MPSIYAHHSFGKKVFQLLPKELKSIVSHHKKAFQIGLQGPDFLFFYHPFFPRKATKLGYSLHKTTARNFIEPLLPTLKEAGTDSDEYAYILGFLCHFILDSECHGYINDMVQKQKYNHLVMEIEFDRFLMEQEHQICPLTYPVYRYIPMDDTTIQAMSNLYRSFDLKKSHIRASLKGMYFFKRILTTGKSIHRALLRAFMFLSTQYKKLEGHMMNLRRKAYAEETNPQIHTRFNHAVPVASELLQSFYKGLLPSRLDCDFRDNTTLK